MISFDSKLVVYNQVGGCDLTSRSVRGRDHGPEFPGKFTKYMEEFVASLKEVHSSLQFSYDIKIVDATVYCTLVILGDSNKADVVANEIKDIFWNNFTPCLGVWR